MKTHILASLVIALLTAINCASVWAQSPTGYQGGHAPRPRPPGGGGHHPGPRPPGGGHWGGRGGGDHRWRGSFYGGFFGWPSFGYSSGSGFSLNLGFPYYEPYYPPYYAPYYLSPRIVTVPGSPQIYIERDTSQSRENYWYYCKNPSGYYPYVRECRDGWLLVPPRPNAR